MDFEIYIDIPGQISQVKDLPPRNDFVTHQ